MWLDKFQFLGCDTEEPFNGEEGLAMMNHKMSDAVIVDLGRPKKNGTGVLTEMGKTQNQKTSAYFFTKHGKYESDNLGWESRAKKIFKKCQVIPPEVAVKALG